MTYDQLNINSAIRSNFLLRLNYRRYARIVEPYVVGFDQRGRIVLIAWQISGGCESGQPSGWKTFLLEEISGSTELAEQFNPVRSAQSSDYMQQQTIKCLMASSGAQSA